MMTRALATTCKMLLCGAMVFMATGCGGDDQRVAAPDSPAGPGNPHNEILLGAPSNLNTRAAGGSDILRWQAPTSETTQTLVGYNVYSYQPDPGTPDSFVRVNGSLVPGGRYVFEGLMAGDEYHVKVRAVDSEGNESDWSATHSFRSQGAASGSDGRPGGLGQSDPDVVEGETGPTH